MNSKKHILIPLLAWAVTPLMAQRIATSTEVIECGQVLYNQPVSASFRLKNKGKAPLVIADVETGCGCTTAQ